MILLDGRETLSTFRRERLNQQLDGAATVEIAQIVYALDGDDAATLERGIALLDATGRAVPMQADDLLILPRLGTISPWASKATDILRAAGVRLDRVERGMRYRVAGLSKLQVSAQAHQY